MEPENGEERCSSSQAWLDRTETQRMNFLETTGSCITARTRYASDCQCQVGIRLRETPAGRDRHNQDEKERRKELTAKVDILATTVGMRETRKSRSWTKIDVLRRARKEIDVLKSKVQRLAETKGEEKMRQERLKGELKGLQRLQPEYPLAVQPEYPIAVQPEYPLAVPPQIWRHEFASAFSATVGKDIPQTNRTVYHHNQRHQSVPAWQEGHHYGSVGGDHIIIPQRMGQTEDLLFDKRYDSHSADRFDFAGTLGLPQVFNRRPVHFPPSHITLIPAASPNMPPLMNFGGGHAECFAFQSPVIMTPPFIPLTPHAHAGSTDSETSTPPNAWNCSPESSPRSDEHHGLCDPSLENTVIIKHEATDSFVTGNFADIA